MPNQTARATIQAQAQVLGPPLHAAVATALAQASNRRRGLDHQAYPYLIPMILRADLRNILEADGLAPGWEIAGKSWQMGQLLLLNPELGLEIRFVKERRRSYPGGVPTAGRNPARRTTWTQCELDIPNGVEAAKVPEKINLLACWDFVSAESLDEFTLRLVHTLAPGTYGSAVPCDLIIDLHGGNNMFTHLRFAGDPDDEDFFRIDVEEGEGQSEL